MVVAAAGAAAAADAAATVTISCLFLMILPSSAAATSAGQQYRLQLQVLGEVVSGPAWGRPLALHLDAALPADVRQAVLGVEAVRRTPHLTLSLGLTHSHGRQEAAAAALPRGPFFSSSSLLHVVVWLRPRRELLQALWLHWKPRNLLFLSLGASGGADVLRDEALSGVARLALIGHLEARADTRPDALGVYTVLPFSPSGVQLLGPWRQESFSRWEALLPDRFPSFQGHTFHVAHKLDEKQSFYPRKAAPGRRGGMSEVMLHAVSAKLNFTYTMTTDSPDSKWGVLVNGSWNGLLGMVERGEKNFTVNKYVINGDRGRDFDFSIALYMDGFGTYVREPLPLPLWTSTARVFQSPIWLAVLSAFVAATCFSLLHEQVSEGRPPRGLSTILLDLQRALLGQSIPAVPPSLPLRVLMSLWLAQCLVLTVAYTSNLVGTFTRPSYPRRLHDLQGVVREGYRLALVDNGNAMVVALKESRDPVLVRLRQTLDLLPSREHCLDAMMAGTHAMMVRALVTTVVRTKKVSGTCYRVGQQVIVAPVVWLFPKHTAWKYKFDHVLQQLLSAGLVDRWMQDEVPEVTEDLETNKSDGPAPPLTLLHFQSILYLLGIVWVCSGAVFLLELLTHRVTHRRLPSPP